MAYILFSLRSFTFCVCVCGGGGGGGGGGESTKCLNCT